MVSQVLCIGQSDSCAGTGIQADIKTVQAFGGYASTIVTAVSVQNTQQLFSTHIIPAIMVHDQIHRVMEDLKPKVIKVGMLGNEDTINMLGDLLDKEDADYDSVDVIIDPVMMNRMGVHYLDKDARDALKRRLLIHADVITPNPEEAFELSGIKVRDLDDMRHAAETLRTLGAKTVVLTGGALASETVYDVLADEDGTQTYEYDLIETTSTRGAGTTLSAGIAVSMAQGLNARDAYVRARAYVGEAMKAAEPIGSGYGPLNHCVQPEPIQGEKAA